MSAPPPFLPLQGWWNGTLPPPPRPRSRQISPGICKPRDGIIQLVMIKVRRSAARDSIARGCPSRFWEGGGRACCYSGVVKDGMIQAMRPMSLYMCQ